MKFRVLECLGIILIMASSISPAHARLNDKYRDGALCIGGVSGVAIGMAALPEPIVSKAIAIGAGSFQGGYYATGFIWNLFDPPDPANACNASNLVDYQIYNFPDMATLVPGVDAQLASDLNVCTGHADELVALSRAIMDANDRMMGAIQIDDLGCATDRMNELNGFIAQFNALRSSLLACWAPVIDRANALDPTIMSSTLSKAQMAQMRADVGNGLFPPEEQIAINAWNLTPSELDILSDFVGSIPDTMIDLLFDSYSASATDIPFDFALMECLQCATGFELTPLASLPLSAATVPTMSPWGLAGMFSSLSAMGTLYLRRKRRGFDQ